MKAYRSPGHVRKWVKPVERCPYGLCAGYAVWVGLACCLVGCDTADETALRQWMATVQASQPPKIAPLPEPLASMPVTVYPEAERQQPDPFSVARAVDTQQKGGPDRRRPREPLEAYPLDAMQMVGVLRNKQQNQALLQVEQQLYRVRVGDYIGQNEGRVVGIEEKAIHLREFWQEGEGEWIEKMATIRLREQ